MPIRQDIGIDLGTATVLVYVRGQGIVLREPSVVALDKSQNRLVAFGEAARDMIGRTSGGVVAIRPLRGGVIADFAATERMLRFFMARALGLGSAGLSRSMFKPRVVVCVPSGVTSVERRAVKDAVMRAGARKAYLIEEPIAAAIGAGVDIYQPAGTMVVDIGGGTTDIAVISMGRAVLSDSVKVAGDAFDEAIARYMRKTYNVMIGERSAEEVKIGIGAAYERVQEMTGEVRGRDLQNGLPAAIQVSSNEIVVALEEPLNAIVDAVHGVLEKTPPELAADIGEGGIVLTGGGGLVYGLDKLLEERTGVRVTLADDPISCVALGTGEALENLEAMDREPPPGYDYTG